MLLSLFSLLACARPPPSQEPVQEKTAAAAPLRPPASPRAAREPNVAEVQTAASAQIAASAQTPASEPARGPITRKLREGIVFVPSERSASLVVYFHGMGASPEDSCSYFEQAATRTDTVLVCPRGNAGASAFVGPVTARRKNLDPLLTLAEQLAPRVVSSTTSRRTLSGFSIGARFALDLARAEPGRWTALVLLSQRLTLSAEELDTAGVRRVVLGAGELDETHAHLQAEARKLGPRARFVSLGKVGHHFAVRMDELMAEALEWAMAE